MPYIKANWPVPKHIRAFTTLRPGGYSLGPYLGFNLAQHVGDDPLLIEKNREFLRKDAQLPEKPIWLSQVHGQRVVSRNEACDQEQADGIYTHEKNKICAILTADCLPLLIAEPKGLGVAALHAGWRGLQQNIIGEGLQKLGLAPDNLMAWLGPAIGKQAYTIGPEVRELFLDNDPSLASAFFQDSEQRWHADLYQIARLQLKALGVTQIYAAGDCTYTDPQRFYSARQNAQTGRMASLIWIAGEDSK